MTQFKVDFNDFKRRDNTNLMEITLYKDSGEKITPNPDHQWSGKALKFGDGDKRLDQELAVTLDGDKIGVPSKQLENLPSGDYGLELWEVNNDNKTIYPSAGFVEFRIHRNADESLESVTPTIDIDKVIDDLHKAGLNVVVDDIEMLAPDAKPSVTSEVRDGKNHIKLHVPRGSKGDQGDIGPAPTLKIGTVTKLNPNQPPTANISGDNGSYTLDLGIPQGPQGDTNATATNALNVANSVNDKLSAIQANGGGRNLVENTNNDITIDATSSNAGNFTRATFYFSEQPKLGDSITVSAEGTLTGTGTLDGYQVMLYDYTGKQQRSKTQYLEAGKRDSVTLTLDNLSGSGDTVLLIYAGKAGETQGKKNVVHHLMVEKGTVAHDWSPAPEDADSAYVNKSGDVMTGSLKAPQVIATDLLTGFHEVIQVPGTTTKIIDLINNNFLQGKDSWKEATFAAYNNALSDAPTNDLYSVIKLVTRGTSRTYVEYSDLSGNLWHTTAVGGTLAPWVKQANDVNVVHNTANETIAGDKAFVGNTTLATTTILAGNYGLRVTSSGIQKTTDGKTWVPANI